MAAQQVFKQIVAILCTKQLICMCLSNNMTKIDSQSAKILFLLDSNARMSSTQIARKLGIPEATARYRIKALQDEGIIFRSYPIFDVGRLGLSVHKLMFKLHRASEREISKVAESIASLGNVNWVARFDGYFDLGCTVVVRNIGELSTFVDEVRKKFHRNLPTIDLQVPSRE